MNTDMKKYAVIGSVVLTIILLSSCVGKAEENKAVEKKEMLKVVENKAMMDDDKMDSKKSEEMEGEWTKEEMEEMEGEHGIMDDDMKVEEIAMIKSEGVYKDYSEEALSGSEGNIVLFFAASWCPSCKTADKNLSAETIPEGLTILKVDYDSHVDLRKKYETTSQHAFVLVDNKGNEIKKWYGSRDVESIIEKIK